MKKKPETKTMKESLDYLKQYINTYDNQKYWEEYLLETWIDDIVYGLGMSINEKFKYRNGYDDFKKFLITYLSGDKSYMSMI